MRRWRSEHSNGGIFRDLFHFGGHASILKFRFIRMLEPSTRALTGELWRVAFFSVRWPGIKRLMFSDRGSTQNHGAHRCPSLVFKSSLKFSKDLTAEGLAAAHW